jgi:hypothetical protein
MICYRVHVPCGARVVGVTADGKTATVLPGEYLVHELLPKVSSAQALVRFVGADPSGRDVHVPLATVRRFLASSANDARTAETARAA